MQICKSKPSTCYSCGGGQGTEAWENLSPEEYWGLERKKEGVGKNETKTTSSQKGYLNTSTTSVRPKSPIFLSLTNLFS